MNTHPEKYTTKPQNQTKATHETRNEHCANEHKHKSQTHEIAKKTHHQHIPKNHNPGTHAAENNTHDKLAPPTQDKQEQPATTSAKYNEYGISNNNHQVDIVFFDEHERHWLELGKLEIQKRETQNPSIELDTRAQTNQTSKYTMKAEIGTHGPNELKYNGLTQHHAQKLNKLEK